jgi:CxxC motif-containing protein
VDETLVREFSSPAMHQMTVQLPVKIGNVIIESVAGTGVNVVATANM